MSFSSAPVGVCLATLRYYKALGDMPLTATEVWRYQATSEGDLTNLSLATVRQTLQQMSHNHIVVEYDGFFQLPDQDTRHIHQKRQVAVVESLHKWFILQKRGAFIIHLPFVRHIRVLGSIAVGNSQTESDLDVSIGVVQGHIWSVRFFVTLVSQLCGVRRHGSSTEDKLCFNHFFQKSSAPYPSAHPFFFQVEQQSILLWSRHHFYSHLKVRRSVMHFKYGVEKFLDVFRIDRVVEKMLSSFQLVKIQHNPTPYPSQLLPLERTSAHIVFYYPKIEKVQKRLRQYTS